MLATLKNHRELVMLLIHLGADINTKSDVSSRPVITFLTVLKLFITVD